MSKDHDYIKELFDSDGIRAPESLSEENMLAMLDAAEEKRYEPARAKARPSLKKWVSAVKNTFSGSIDGRSAIWSE